MKKIKLACLGMISALLPLLSFPAEATATAPPDSISIESVQIVKSTVQPNDFALVFHYNLAYSTYPTEPASSTFIFRLYSPDGATLLASEVPYAYFNNGYGNGVSGFYFSNTTAPAWGDAYILNISGSPAFFDPLPTPVNYIVNSADYSSVTTQADNQVVMRDYVFAVCNLMELAYPTVSLHGSTDTALALTTTGEAYFRAAVPGIQNIAPGLFVLQVFTPTISTISTNLSLTQTHQTTFEGSDLGHGFARVGAKWFSLNTSAMAGLTTFVLALIVFIAAAMLPGWGPAIGLQLDTLVLMNGALFIGGAVEIILISFAFICGIVLASILYLRKG